jgi:hypothetical protein
MKLFVAMPWYGGRPWQSELSLNGLIREGVPGVSIRLKVLQGESNIVEARNMLTAQFLQSDCERLLFLDADMVFQPSQVARVVSHEEPVVGGLYCKKQPGAPEYCCVGLPGQERGVPDSRGLIEVERIATGFLCIQRGVFERMERELKPTRYWTARGQQSDFWKVEYQARADGELFYHGEDYAWCARWRGMGGKLFADAQVLVGHVGSMVFPEGWEALAGLDSQAPIANRQGGKEA